MMQFPTLQGIAGMSVSLNMYSFKIRLCVHMQKKNKKKSWLLMKDSYWMCIYYLCVEVHSSFVSATFFIHRVNQMPTNIYNVHAAEC